MKRDLDLTRYILLEAEKAPAGIAMQTIECPDEYDGPTVIEHIKLLIDAGFLEGDAQVDRSPGSQGGMFVILGLTWSGHDFLDAVRDTTIWRETKEKVTTSGGSIAFELIKEVAISLVRSSLGLP